MSSEWFRKVPEALRHSLTFFLGVLRLSEVFSCVLSGYERLMEVQKRHLTLWGNLRCLHWF